jgi:aspartate ammonia-lyase
MVPDGVYYGVHTLRAVENFPITGTSIGNYPDLVRALVWVKMAACEANRELGLIPSKPAAAIIGACEDIIGGSFFDQFPIDVLQGGAGTSTNMNANEVIANRALERLGERRGDYLHVHPLDHVNLGQSTNDVYPTALKVAAQVGITRLTEQLRLLQGAFATKAREFAGHLKIGRTQLQDAVPMTLGQEFASYAVMLGEDADRLSEAAALVTEINLGGTAIGTGLNTHPEYAATVCRHLRAVTGLPLVTAPDLIEATQDVGSFVQVSAVLKRVAVKLSKVCNDLRLLSSGPHAGFGDISLPPMQAGSSIMPGKVNPVIPEVVNQVAFRVIGNDITVTMAAEAGQLQLNAFEPIIGHCLFESLTQLTNACEVLRTRCVTGITANVEHMRSTVTRSVGLVTALNPHIGYEAASRLAGEALRTGGDIATLALELQLLTEEQLHTILRPENLTQPRRHTGRDV